MSSKFCIPDCYWRTQTNATLPPKNGKRRRAKSKNVRCHHCCIRHVLGTFIFRNISSSSYNRITSWLRGEFQYPQSQNFPNILNTIFIQWNSFSRLRFTLHASTHLSIPHYSWFFTEVFAKPYLTYAAVPVPAGVIGFWVLIRLKEKRPHLEFLHFYRRLLRSRH